MWRGDAKVVFNRPVKNDFQKRQPFWKASNYHISVNCSTIYDEIRLGDAY